MLPLPKPSAPRANPARVRRWSQPLLQFWGVFWRKAPTPRRHHHPPPCPRADKSARVRQALGKRVRICSSSKAPTARPSIGKASMWAKTPRCSLYNPVPAASRSTVCSATTPAKSLAKFQPTAKSSSPTRRACFLAKMRASMWAV